jgi:hypothetical protein
MVKSLIQGEYYMTRPSSTDSKKQKFDYIAHNKRMTKEYSKLVAGTRPHTATPFSSGQKSAGVTGAGPFQNLTVKATKEVM